MVSIPRLVERSVRISRTTLSCWLRVKGYETYRAGATFGRLKGASSRQAVSAEQMEISRLRAELARVKMERDILGKATAYFAKGQK